MKLSARFNILRDEINSTAPNVERCRDWCETLADICEELALQVEMIQADKKTTSQTSKPANIEQARDEAARRNAQQFGTDPSWYGR
jgi:hypothetical protein